MPRRNKACPCCNSRFKTNVELVKHMQSDSSCQLHLQVCPGCSKSFATKVHLENHQRQQQTKGVWCYDTKQKQDIVSTLQLSNMATSSSLINSPPIALVNTNTNENNVSTLNIAIEQLRPKANPTAQSIYGLTNTTKQNVDGSIRKYGYHNESHSLFRKTTESLFVSEEELTTAKCKRAKMAPEAAEMNTTNENHSFMLKSSSNHFKTPNIEKAKVLCRQQQIENEIQKMKHGQQIANSKQSLYDAKISNGDSYSLLISGQEDDEELMNDDEECSPQYEEFQDSTVPEAESSLHIHTINSFTTGQQHNEDVRVVDSVQPSDDEESFQSIVDDDMDYLSEFLYFADVADQHNDTTNEEKDNDVNNNIDQQDDYSNFGQHSAYIRKRTNETVSYRQSVIWNEVDYPLIDLYHMHRKSRAPIGLFDETLNWLEKHASVLFDKNKKCLNHLPKRQSFVKNMYSKVYGKKNAEKVKPKLIKVDIPTHNTSINATLFDFREVLVDMLSNELIMSPEHLQFYDDKDPTKIHPVGVPFSNVITSDVFRRAHKRLCTGANDVLWPLVVYNDEINFDSHGKLKLDPLQLSFLRLPQFIRNQPFAWRTFGVVHNLESRMFPKTLSGAEKLQVQHNVLEQLYKMVEILQQEGGIPWKMKLKDGTYREVVLKIYIQFIIGDTKGHDQHCGRMGAHSTGMNQCVRDCDVDMDGSDNPNHHCTFRKISDFDDLDIQECKQLSFHKINNCYSFQDMGDEIHGIFGATPGEPLHIIDSGLCPMVSEVVKDDLSLKCFESLEKAVMNIVTVVQRQTSAKYMPSINAFRNGLVKISSLTGKEKSARLFAMFLALMSSDCCKLLATSKEKGVGNHNIYGEDRVEQWLKLFENTLCFRMWLKEEVIPADQLYSNDWSEEWKQCFSKDDGGNDIEDDVNHDLPTEDDHMVIGSIAQNKIVLFLQQYHQLISFREGNGLKIPKFHLCLHFVRNICRHGPVNGYDGARSEANAKELAKCPGLRTQKHHKSISFQTAIRYHEDLTLVEAERMMLEKCPHFNLSYSYFNKRNEDKHMPDVSLEMKQESFSTKGSSRFSIQYIPNRARDERSNLKTYKVEWENKLVQPTERINDEMLQCLAYWLFIDPRGGRISANSICQCFTDTKINNISYRCHPCFRSEEAWYDWVYVKWEGYDNPIPARVYLFFHLVGCDFEKEDDIRADYGINAVEQPSHELLTNTASPSFLVKDFIQMHQYWAVIHSAEDAEIPRDKYPTKFHLSSKIAKRVKMEDKKFRLVPLNSIVGPCFGMFNHSLLQSDFDNTAIIVDPPNTWAEKFILE